MPLFQRASEVFGRFCSPLAFLRQAPTPAAKVADVPVSVATELVSTAHATFTPNNN